MGDSMARKPSILIVDDAETQRYILRNVVLEMGYQPVLAASGEQALRVFPRCSPRLVLLDLEMPEMDGFEVMRRLRGEEGARGVPVIFVTATESQEDVARMFEAGAADYVAKPYLPEVVKARVGVHMRLAEAMERLAGLGG